MTVRRMIRIKAFQALFQLAYNDKVSKDEAIKFALAYPLNLKEELNELDELDELEVLKASLPVKKVSDKVAADALAYLKELVLEVKSKEQFLDEEISKKLQNWTIHRIELTNLLILRIASYELYFHEEIDPSIVMNEAIELTKTFNNDDASKFVNGVLQGILDAKEA